MRTKSIAAVVIIAATLGTIALAEGNWDDAKSKYEEFKGKYQDLRTLTPTETKKLVTASASKPTRTSGVPWHVTSVIESQMSWMNSTTI